MEVIKLLYRYRIPCIRKDAKLQKGIAYSDGIVYEFVFRTDEKYQLSNSKKDRDRFTKRVLMPYFKDIYGGGIERWSVQWDLVAMEQIYEKER